MAESRRHGVAIFGLGRAGMIHFLNLVRNHRVSILYIVERDLLKANEAVDKYRLTETKTVDADDADQVYEDPRWVWRYDRGHQVCSQWWHLADKMYSVMWYVIFLFLRYDRRSSWFVYQLSPLTLQVTVKSCGVTQTMLSSSLSETIGSRMNLRNVGKVKTRTVHL